MAYHTAPRLTIFRLALLILCTAGLALASNASAQSTEPVPIRKVVLFSSGVGYFEHSGTVSGTEATTLRFQDEQIKDVLKSLVVQDLDGGRVGTVVYPSQNPLERTLGSFAVDLTTPSALGDLLNQLRGSAVRLSTPEGAVSGTILSAEARQIASNGATESEWLLSLYTNGSIRTVPLDAVTNLTFVDTQLQEEMRKALSALAEARSQGKKPVQVQFEGQGTRRVRFGYVVETPIWKTSYRLVMPDGDATQGQLQGWAIVENQTEADWENVDLVLVSGQPISFIQDLYTPLYADRPLVERDLTATNIRPRAYDAGVRIYNNDGGLNLGDASIGGVVRDAQTGEPIPGANVRVLGTSRGVSTDARGRFEVKNVAPGSQAVAITFIGYERTVQSVRKQSGKPLRMEVRLAPSSQALEEVVVTSALSERVRDEMLDLDLNESVPEPFDPTQGVESRAQSADLGDLFQYQVSGVSLPRGRSAMIPIVTQAVGVERTSVYNAAAYTPHPLRGARLENETALHLAQGPVTVFDESAYAGDARLNDVPPGQDRLLTYAIDQDLRIDQDGASETATLQTGHILDGVLEIKRKRVAEVTYTLANASGQARTVIIEHPRLDGWTLTRPEAVLESTPTHHRLQARIAADATDAFTVEQEAVEGEEIALLNSDADLLQFYAQNDDLPRDVRSALKRAIDLRRDAERIGRELDNQRRTLSSVTRDQERIRDNMQSVDAESDYYERLLNKLEDQEDQIERIDERIGKLRQEQRERQADYRRYLGGLDVD